MQKSSDLHQESYPVASYQLKDGSYVDDVGITGKGKEEVKMLTEQCDKILKLYFITTTFVMKWNNT